MNQVIPLHECEKLHPQQWVKLYGVISGRYNHINTCQVYQLEILIGNIPRGWWNEYVLEPVDEKEQPIPVAEALRLSSS